MCIRLKFANVVLLLTTIISSYSLGDSPPEASLHLKAWGNLGNSLVQLRSILYIALFYNYTEITFPQHEFLPTRIAIHHKITRPAPAKSIIISGKDAFKIDRSVWKHCMVHVHDKEVQKLMLNNFNIHFEKYTPLLDGVLVIHVRSGDIFRVKIPHEGYAQPPLSFYVNAISRFSPSKIIIVAEDILNPCVTALL